MAFEDYIWGLALRRNAAPYDPRNTLFSKMDEIQKETRAENAVARRDARAFENAKALEQMRENRMLALDEQRQKRAAELMQQARTEADILKSVNEIEQKNAARDILYSNADAAAKYVGGQGSGWKVDPSKSPEENEAAAARAIQHSNAMVYRRLEQQYEEAQAKIADAQSRIQAIVTPTDKEIGQAVAGDLLGLPKSLADDKSGRLAAIANGNINAALKNLPAEDVAVVQGLIAKHEQSLADAKTKRHAAEIGALNRQAVALASKNSTMGARLQELGKRVFTTEPIYMLVDPKELRPTELPAGSAQPQPPVTPFAQAQNVGALRHQDELAIERPAAMAPGPGIGSLRMADEQRMNSDREMAIALGMDILSNSQRPMDRFDSELGLSNATSLEPSYYRYTALGDPIKGDISVEQLMNALGSFGSAASSTAKRTAESVASAIEQARVRGPQLVDRVRQAIGVDPRPEVAAGSSVGLTPIQPFVPLQMPSTNTFIPMLQYNATNQVSPADVVREYLKSKYQFNPAPAR